MVCLKWFSFTATKADVIITSAKRIKFLFTESPICSCKAGAANTFPFPLMFGVAVRSAVFPAVSAGNIIGTMLVTAFLSFLFPLF